MTYPILQFFVKDKNIYGQATGPARASVSLFNYFVNSVILDTDGYQYKVRSVYKVKWLYLCGYHPLKKGRTAIIDYNFSEKNKLDLPAFKQLVIDKLALGVKKNFWYTKGEIPILIEKVNKCPDYQSVIECFIYDLYS